MRVYGRWRTRLRALRSRRALLAVAPVVLIAGVVGVHAMMLQGQIVGGVSVAGVQVGGHDAAGARAVLTRQLGSRLDQAVTLHVNGHTAQVTPRALGIRLDVAATTRRALRVGRVRGELFPFGFHATVDPVLHVPSTFRLPPALVNLMRPATNAELTLDPQGRAHIKLAHPGLGFDRHLALVRIAQTAIGGGHDVVLRPRPVSAPITTAAAIRAERRVRTMLSKPITVERPGFLAAQVAPKRLAPMLVVHSYKHSIGLGFDPAQVDALLRPTLGSALHPPRDASWSVQADRGVVVTSLNGVALNGALTARHMAIAAQSTLRSQRVARIAFTTLAPQRTTKDARALGATHVVAAFTSDMGDSSPNRIFNVHKMADMLQDYVVAPGATFSFNSAVGPRTAERGFKEGQAIENGQLVPSIGGGVCQVATTIFNAVIAGGYPITERHNHSFYISHYPLGLDATVADGGPDFVFVNDTAHAIVMKTGYTDTTLTVAFLSAPLHRTVKVTTSARTGITQPKRQNVLDPTLPAGSKDEVVLGEEGFDVTVTRTVYAADGTVIRTFSFPSHYTPEDTVYHVGPAVTPPASTTTTTPTGTTTTPTGTTTTPTGTTTTPTDTTTTPTDTTTAPTTTVPTTT